MTTEEMGEDSPLQGYMTFLDALHVEAHGGDGAMTVVSAWTSL